MTPTPTERDRAIEQARAQLRALLYKERPAADLRTAIHIWQRLGDLIPDSSEPLAALYIALRQFPEAKQTLLVTAATGERRNDPLRTELALRRIVDFDPADLKCRARLADLFRQQGRWEDAVEQQLAIAYCLEEKGHRREAIEVLDLGLKTAGAHPELRWLHELLVTGGNTHRDDEATTLLYFQLRDIFDEESLIMQLDQPHWAARHAEFVGARTSPDPLVRSRARVPAEIVRALAWGCRCNLRLYADPDGDTLHCGRPQRATAGEAVQVSTARAFAEYGADAVWLASEYGHSRKGEIDGKFRGVNPGSPPTPT